MGKLTISMAIFNSYVTNYQRVIAMEMCPIYRSGSHNKISRGDLSLLCLIKTLSRFHGWIGPQEVSHSVARSAATASSIAPSTIGPHVVVAASGLSSWIISGIQMWQWQIMENPWQIEIVIGKSSIQWAILPINRGFELVLIGEIYLYK